MAAPCAAHRVWCAVAAAPASSSALPIRSSLCRPCLSQAIRAPRRPSSWARCSSTDLHQRTQLEQHTDYGNEATQANSKTLKKGKRTSRTVSPSTSASTASTGGPRRSSKAYADLPTHASGSTGEPFVPLEPFVPITSKRAVRRKKPQVPKSSDEASQGTKTSEATADGTLAPTRDADQGRQPGQGDVDIPRIDELGPQGQAWPPLAKDVLTNLARFPGCLLLTRVGGFYESYFDQAPPLSILLSLKLASRTWGGRPVPMAGFPISQLEKYLKILVEDNRRLVAICEEFRSDESGVEGESPADWKMINALKSSAKGAASGEEKFNEKVEITRRVTRVVSPGTLIDEKWMNPLKNNFILSVASLPKITKDSADPQEGSTGFGLAWLDLSTSDLHVSECSDVESLRDEIKRIAPSEVVIEDGLDLSQTSAAGTPPGQRTEVGDEAAQFWQMLDGDRTLLSYVDPDTSSDTASAQASSLEAEATHSYKPVERRAIRNLTSHLRKRLIAFSSDSAQTGNAQMDNLIASGMLIRHHLPSETMMIDCNTLDALEVKEATREGGVRGSLVSTVRRTISKGGARLLVEWLTSPSTSHPVISFRHSVVALLLSRPFLHEDLRTLFRRRISRGDISRTIQRIATGRNDEQDLLEVKDFVKFIGEVKETIKQDTDATAVDEEIEGRANLSQLCDALIELTSLGDRLEGAIDERVMEIRARAMEAMEREEEERDESDGEEVEVTVRSKAAESPAAIEIPAMAVRKGEEDPWGAPFEHLIRPSSSKQLSSLTKEYEALRHEASTLQTSLRARFNQGKLSLRFLLGQGFVVHFADYRSTTSSDAASSSPSPEDHFTLAYRTKSTRTFYFDRWSSLGSRLLRLQEELKRAESLELRRLRSLVLQSSSTLRANARRIDELDCLMGFATLARELALTRPEMVQGEEGIFEVRGGRHIGVELGLLERSPARSFHSNDLIMSPANAAEGQQGGGEGRDDGGGRLHFITGPNMGGKSTYLRQNALIAILAQTGSFVPAAHVRMSVVDRLFSRVGAKDDLFRDRSTFMVEMLETSEILRRATSRSFVIADEIGRGTTTNVGIAIAFATLTELSKIGCRALFATHLHELADRMGYDERTHRGSESFSHVRFASTDVVQGENTITYLHALRPGVNRESHGLTVAALAGMPASALQVARETLRSLSVEGEGKW
ncbi:hypothetical protein BCV69DRAFT_281091 [Microstroma glucosiphilum]|uniref:DNA mismatch repair protein n=1 Tax=Pseudomicrostroma glucosiphilum TaxID=1684307 RepID=A0A316UCG5_9BASI|nr:hypothetical protein BCV69DRAFT_281091 [Pseudomicrostroma glucosiphilum]PWN22093.1 hypothetical protein BCV69DRAFT_281091 [Pseudomicrostroma glucosiphilum]